MANRTSTSDRPSRSLPVCIPARTDSSRFPGKLLAPWGETTVLAAVYSEAVAAALGPVWVLAGDEAIAAKCEEEGLAWMPAPGRYRNGSERIASALRSGALSASPEGWVLSLQGDAIGAPAQALHAAASALSADPGAALATAALLPTTGASGARGRTRLRMDAGRAVDFWRGEDVRRSGGPDLLHLGIYAYRVEQLLRLSLRPPGPRETGTSLEQFRWLEAGEAVAAAVLHGPAEWAHAIDHRADLSPLRAPRQSAAQWPPPSGESTPQPDC